MEIGGIGGGWGADSEPVGMLDGSGSNRHACPGEQSCMLAVLLANHERECVWTEQHFMLFITAGHVTCRRYNISAIIDMCFSLSSDAYCSSRRQTVVGGDSESKAPAGACSRCGLQLCAGACAQSARQSTLCSDMCFFHALL